MKNIKGFISRWKGDEKSETQTFWISLLRDVLGVEKPDELIQFEKRVELDHVSYIDAYIPTTHVIIEQKSINVSLDKATVQSDGQELTPFGQAKRYSDWLPASQRADWIVTCNFKEIQIHDMEKPKAAPEVIALQNLEKDWNKLKFLVNPKAAKPKDIREEEISVKAGELVGRLYSSLQRRYNDKKDNLDAYLRVLNIFCVRIVFLLYAEDAGLFKKSAFHDYMLRHKDSAREALMTLFTVLDQKPEERDPYLADDLASFPYVDGDLFEEQGLRFPQLDGEPWDIIIKDMSEGFDWSKISPTIFGAVFESTLNPETRRTGGMHYTSVENIHKVIDPLFLNALTQELDDILSLPKGSGRSLRLTNYQKRLAKLEFLDPACGSGNFLTETYLCLRRLENRALSERRKQIEFVTSREELDYIKVSIGQFYGIEINDFAVSVARTALWIAESQMYNETKKIVHVLDDFLPLRSYHHIIEGNALRMDWGELVKAEELNYIMGNPPFVGKKEQTQDQKSELTSLFDKGISGTGNLDYVCAWYVKAIKFIQDSEVKVALVSTNSITQGEQVPILWTQLLKYSASIHFAWRTFVWNNEASDKAHVHVVIIGFSQAPIKGYKLIYLNDGTVIQADNINPYLVDAPTILIKGRNENLCPAPKIMYGSMPIDSGNLVLKTEDVEKLLNENPANEKYIRKYIGGEELLYNKFKYCLWLKDATPADMKRSPFIRSRVELNRQFRLASHRPQTVALADVPHLFGEIRQPDCRMLVIPKVSSENRFYLPMKFVEPDIIVSGSALIIPDAGLYEFGVLSSSVHMAWMRTVAGRLEMRYQYSGTIVYNNFVWPSSEQRGKIEATAQSILSAREKYVDNSLNDLYDSLLMPLELRKAHRANDEAVLAAYGFPKDIREEEIVAKLMVLYSQKIEETEHEK